MHSDNMPIPSGTICLYNCCIINIVKLTDEQQAIIQHKGNLRINAFAGTGKTTTLLEYAKVHSDKTILYIAFNRSVKEEAIKRFRHACLYNTQIETAHSLAYHSVNAKRYKISSGFKVLDAADLLSFKSHASTDPLYHIALSQHALNWLIHYCNNTGKSGYLNSIKDNKAYKFAKSNLLRIEDYGSFLLHKMSKGEIEIIHDYYLKEYQLSKPKLHHDIILFDEGQDASPVMLDVFLRQNGTKVIVGDEHQQIYSFRHAVNSLEMVNFKKLYLTGSFRFRQDIADLATEILNLKKILGSPPLNVKIKGYGDNKSRYTYAILARSNIGLLDKAIDKVFIKNIKEVYFEGNINSYIFSSEGTSIYDVLNLSINKKDNIRSGIIKRFGTFEDLTLYIDETDDRELALIVSIVKKYGTDLFTYLPGLKQFQTEKHKAKIIFSTVHKSKGMEYDIVDLAEDFISEKDINRFIENEDAYESFDIEHMKEEINILYVAMTRSRNKLFVPDTLFENAKEILKESQFVKNTKRVYRKKQDK